MGTAAETAYASEAALDICNPLLALRRAAWPFRRALIRSEQFNRLLGELADIEPELTSISSSLVDRLYRAIPKASPTSRGHLLALKRAVFNHRPVPGAHDRSVAESDDESLVQLLSRYTQLMERRERIFGENSQAVLDELRASLAAYLSQTDFRLALEASSPTLFGAISRYEDASQALSDRTCRSLYAYVCRFSTKANPLHLFSHLIPGPSMRGPEANPSREPVTCEVVFNVRDILSLEQRMLAGVVERSRIRLALTPLLRKGSGWEVWVKRDNKWYTAFLPDQPILGRLREIYDERCENGLPPSLTRADLERALGDAGDREIVSQAVDKLIDHGVLVAHLLDDLRAPAPALRGLDETADDLVACIDRWHIACVDKDALGILGRELVAARSGSKAPLSDVRYYVNSYAHDDVTRAERAAHELARPLAELKPVLTGTNNFARQNRVIQAFFRCELQEGTTRPYTDLLAAFFRRRVEILENLQWGRAPPEYDAFTRRCRAYDNRLEPADLRALASEAPASSGDSVCFVGPFDFVTRRFFLTNLFAGDQRSIARFLLTHRRSAHGGASQAIVDPSVLDVELAVPPVENLTFVAKRFDVGCGFEGRWARGYRQWLDPVRIDVAVRDGSPIFIDRPTGRRLRFHYLGLLQAQFLPIEYQLLLAGHADNYRNPFAVTPASDTDVEHRPALYYGPVCLRREAWCVPTSFVLRLTHKRDVLSATVAVRRWVRDRLAAEDLWFYRFPYDSPGAQKPRLLDLLSPLSTVALRRDLSHDASHVVFCRMEPAPAGLWKSGGDLYAAELMVEA